MLVALPLASLALRASLRPSLGSALLFARVAQSSRQNLCTMSDEVAKAQRAGPTVRPVPHTRHALAVRSLWSRHHCTVASGHSIMSAPARSLRVARYHPRTPPHSVATPLFPALFPSPHPHPNPNPNPNPKPKPNPNPNPNQGGVRSLWLLRGM